MSLSKNVALVSLSSDARLFFSRVCAPFTELGEDAFCLVHHSVSSTTALVSAEGKTCTDNIVDCSTVVLGNVKQVMRSLATALEEWMEDANLGEKHAWAACLATASILSGPVGSGIGASWVMICGLSLPLHVLSGSGSIALAAGACAVLSRFDKETNSDFALQRRWAVGLLAFGGLHFALINFGAIHPGFATVTQFCKDSLVNPMLVAILGYLAGLHQNRTIFGPSLPVVGTAALAVTASVSEKYYRALGEGARFLVPLPPISPSSHSRQVQRKHFRRCRRQGRKW